MRLYIVRHGQSEGNQIRVHQTPDTPLSDQGRHQAEFLAKRLAKIGLDQIVASPQTRAKETAEIINHSLSLPISFDENLVEYRRPSILMGRAWDDVEAEKLKAQIEERWHENWRHSDEETFGEYQARINAAIESLVSLNKEKILVVTHGLSIRMILALMGFGDSLKPEVFRKLFHFITVENTGITICERRQHLNGSWHWKLITANDHAHLE